MYLLRLIFRLWKLIDLKSKIKLGTDVHSERFCLAYNVLHKTSSGIESSTLSTDTKLINRTTLTYTT
jgi:hypothetical protein